MTRLQTIGLIALLAVAPAAYGQFEVDWYTIDSGGAMFTTGGVFELSGTIGQSDAGSFSQPLTGGVFELVGGFWPVAAGCNCPGDIDGDCLVALADLSQVLSSFGLCSGNPGFVQAADFDSNGCVDLADLSFLLSRFGVSCS